MKHILLIAIVILLMNCECKKFVSIDLPKTQIAGAAVFSNDATAISAVTGIYGRIMNGTGFASGNLFSVTYLTSLYADELTNYSQSQTAIEFYNNTLTPANTAIRSNLWGDCYQYIYTCNSIMEGLNNSNKISNTVKSQLIGEVKFMRAFCYFNLVNLFGDVPLILTTNYAVNAIATRTGSNKVYEQIFNDLKDAQDLLEDGYSSSNGERIRPNKWAAKALLARVYLYNHRWQDAEQVATNIINNTMTYHLSDDLNQVFLANSPEAIWQLQPVVPSVNTWEGNIFILNQAPANAAFSDAFLQSFEPGDQRRYKWIDSIVVNGKIYFFPYKYKVKSGSVLTEYSMVLRLSEQYLIRAEARAQQNDLPEAIADLNIIRKRAGLNDLPDSLTKDQVLASVMRERQSELFTEWGSRWYDLKRTGHADSVLSAIKPKWKVTDTLFPIPQSEITADPNLSQNEGY